MKHLYLFLKSSKENSLKKACEMKGMGQPVEIVAEKEEPGQICFLSHHNIGPFHHWEEFSPH